jgi:hypothetical protein
MNIQEGFTNYIRLGPEEWRQPMKHWCLLVGDLTLVNGAYHLQGFQLSQNLIAVVSPEIGRPNFLLHWATVVLLKDFDYYLGE